MLILSDFDGTITSEDVTNVLWDQFGIDGWRERLLPPYREGLVSTLELMDEGWRAISVGQAELLEVAHRDIGLRAGFLEFVETCARQAWGFHVVSCGLDWYLSAFLPAGVAYTCYRGVLEDGWRVRLPAGCSLPAGTDFKIHVMRGLLDARGADSTVFIGDGRNDLPIARACDKVFAVRGSTLARLCREHHVPCEEFEDFRSIAASLLAAPSPEPRSSTLSQSV